MYLHYNIVNQLYRENLLLLSLQTIQIIGKLSIYKYVLV